MTAVPAASAADEVGLAVDWAAREAVVEDSVVSAEMAASLVGMGAAAGLAARLVEAAA